MKKKYIKPTIIDLTIEGITGIGAGGCTVGQDYGNETCGIGNGVAIGSCFTGSSASSICTFGYGPNESGNTCFSGEGNIGMCNTGASASGVKGICVNGEEPTNDPSNYCSDGQTDALSCYTGENPSLPVS